MPDSSIAQRLASLPRLGKPALCELWRQLFKTKPPLQMQKGPMLRMVARRLQEQQSGGLSDASRGRHRQPAGTFEANANAAAQASSRPARPPTHEVKTKIVVPFLVMTEHRKQVFLRWALKGFRGRPK